MDPRIQIAVEYVRSQRVAGVSDGAISAALLQIGWPQDFVTAAFNAVGQPPQPDLQAGLPVLPQVQPVELAQTTQPVQDVQPVQAVQPAQSVPVDTRQKYKIRAAFADVYHGLKVNWLTYLICIAAAIAAAFALFSIIGLIVAGVIQGTHGDFLSKLYPGFGILVVFYIITVILLSITNALFVSMLALCIRDGLDGHRGNVMATIKEMLHKLLRVVLTNALTSVVTYGPLVIGLIIMVGVFLAAVFSGIGGKSFNIGGLIVSSLLVIAGGLWSILATVRFVLAPYVALFEPQVSVWHTLGRSRTLLRKGGEWFLIKGFLLMLLVYGLVAIITGNTLKEAINSNSVIVIIINILTSLLVYGGLYTLYRNRVAVKK